MDRASRLKNLSEELRRLFEQNSTEQEAYDQLKDDDRFDAVQLAKVSEMYKQFRSEKEEKPFYPQLTEFLHRSGQLAYFQSILECDYKKPDCLKFWNGESADGRFFITFDWTQNIEDASNSSLEDVFNNKTCRIKLPITQVKDYAVWPLTHNIGLLIEYFDYDDQDTFSKFSLSLLKLDWTEKEMRKIHTLPFEDQQHRFEKQMIAIDAVDPTRFLLQWCSDGFATLKLGKVHNDEIVFGEDIFSMDEDIGTGSVSLAENTLYSFDSWKFDDSNESCIYVTQLDQGAQTSEVTLNSLPEQFSTVSGEDDDIIGCFAMDRLFLAVRHKETKNYGIIWADCKTRKWELINFCTKEPITSIQFMIDRHVLCIQTTDKETELISLAHQLQKTFYRIPLKKPEKLYDLAWFSLIRSKSKLECIDTYEEAQKYLPYYSEIRCPFEE